MLEAVFISDLHLESDNPKLLTKFDEFLLWAQINNIKNLYILGDLFNIWFGDDCINDWSKSIANKFAQLNAHGTNIYFIAGNRDFLLGKKFAKLARFNLLLDPSVINLNGENILLTHGDRYCLLDKSHQILCILTRNWLFINAFLLLSKKIRINIAKYLKNRSRYNKSLIIMDVLESEIIRELHNYKIYTVIHGHTHKPKLTVMSANHIVYNRYVLGAWDDNLQILCYSEENGFEYMQQFNIN